MGLTGGYELEWIEPDTVVQLNKAGEMVGSAILLFGQWSGTYHPGGFGFHHLANGNDPRITDKRGNLVEADDYMEILVMIKARHEAQNPV